MHLTHTELVHLADVVRRRSGLAIPLNKANLIRNKLVPVAARYGYKNVGALIEELHHDEPEEMASAVTEALTTNETSFFRDRACLEHFRTGILPALKMARATRRHLRIWCAACSTGQEAYSLAMLLDEAGLADEGWKIDLFATDLSTEAIARTESGLYAPYETQRGLSARHLVRYFTQEGELWRICERLRRGLRVRRFNLLDHYGWLGEIDAIFCRNVLLYFDHQAKLETLARLDRCLAPDGWLVLGANESVSGTAFMPAGVARGIYVKARNVLGRQARLAG